MKNIDYTSYTLPQLLECQNNIDKETFPENWSALEQEIALRDDQKDLNPELTIADQKKELKIAEKRVQIIGYFQFLGAALIAYFLIFSPGGSNHSTTNISVAIFFILLNLVSGYTAIKEMYGWYWLSILNQGLQIISVSVGTYIINYTSIGGLYIGIYWSEGGVGINFTANFYPGLAFYQLTEELSKNIISYDVLAVLFFAALITVRDKKLNPEVS